MAENFFGITHTGQVRENNEDAFLAERLRNGQVLACVIDGVGGYEGGEVAAAIARETIAQTVHNANGDLVVALREGLLRTNENIYREKEKGNANQQMACVVTLAVVDVTANEFRYAHVGDTRLYLLRDNTLVKLTKDHSFVGFLEDSGRLSEKEAMAHPKRNEINKALGFDPQIAVKDDYIETGSSPFLPGDLLLLCSDGLTDLVDRETMSAILRASKTLSDKAEALVTAANNAGGKDNITVVLVANDRKPLKQKATKPVLSKKNETSQALAPANGDAPLPPPTVSRRPKGSSALAWGLAVLALLLAGTCFWLWQKNTELESRMPEPLQPYVPNEAERKLADSLGTAKQSLQLQPAAVGGPFVIGDTLFVRQDSLHINGNGAVLEADSAYRGPALLVSANNNYLLLENISFKNFSTAVQLQGRSLQLRNVQFQNVGTPVGHLVQLPANQSLTGIIRDSVRLKTDSVPAKQQP